MTTILYLILLFAIAYLGSLALHRFLTQKFGKQIIAFYGAEFLLIGFILGPEIIGLISTKILQQLKPILALGIGWAGFVFGSQLNLQDLKKFPQSYISLSLGQAFGSFLIISIGLFLYTFYNIDFGSFDFEQKTSPGFTLAILYASIGSITSPIVFSYLAQRHRLQSKSASLIYFVSSLDAVWGLIPFTAAFIFYHTQSRSDWIFWQHALWISLSLGFGFIMGYVFRLIVRLRLTRLEFILIIIGLIIFSSGAAWYLGFSPLIVNFITGIITANTLEKKVQVMDTVVHFEKTFYFLFLLLAGAYWQLPQLPLFILALIYVLLRVFSKWISFQWAYRFIMGEKNKSSFMGLALIPQGGMALAMAIELWNNFPLIWAKSLLTGVVLCLLICNLVATVLIPSLFREGKK